VYTATLYAELAVTFGTWNVAFKRLPPLTVALPSRLPLKYTVTELVVNPLPVIVNELPTIPELGVNVIVSPAAKVRAGWRACPASAMNSATHMTRMPIIHDLANVTLLNLRNLIEYV
jgi:hypothetical protein